MTDERTISAATEYGQRMVDEKRKQMQETTTTYQVVAIGFNNNEPIVIEAQNAEDRTNKMAKAGIDPSRAQWAAGHLDADRTPQICGRSEEAKRIVRAALTKKR